MADTWDVPGYKTTRSGGGGTQMEQHWDERAEESTASPWVNPNKTKSAPKSNGSALIFPRDLGTSAEQQNYMMFIPKKINGGSGDARTLTFTTLPGYPCVCLPIPTGLNTQYTQSWSAASVEGRNAMLADKGGNVLKSVSEALTRQTANPHNDEMRSQTAGEILDKLKGSFNFGGAGRNTLNALKNSDWWNEAAGGVASELGAMIAAGPMEGLATAAQYTTGMRAVKQTMMSYGGPGFRSFS